MEAEQLPAPPIVDPATKVETPEEAKVRRAKERIEARKRALEEERRAEEERPERQLIPA